MFEKLQTDIIKGLTKKVPDVYYWSYDHVYERYVIGDKHSIYYIDNNDMYLNSNKLIEYESFGRFDEVIKKTSSTTTITTS